MSERYGVDYMNRDALAEFIGKMVEDAMPVFPGGWLDMISGDLSAAIKEAAHFPDQDDLTWETLEDHANAAIWELGRMTLTGVGIEAPDLKLADALALIEEEPGMVDSALASLGDPFGSDDQTFSRRVRDAAGLATYLIAGELFERWRADVVDALKEMQDVAWNERLNMDEEED